MSFEELLANESLKRHHTSREEVADLFAAADRDMADADAKGLSTDRRFILLYEAALSLTMVALVSTGYRTVSAGHHITALRTLPLTLGQQLTTLSDYLDKCRRLRHEALYERVGVALQSDADELAQVVAQLRERVLTWLAENHPHLLPEV